MIKLYILVGVLWLSATAPSNKYYGPEKYTDIKSYAHEISMVLGNGPNNNMDLLLLATLAQETNMGNYRDRNPNHYGIGIAQIEMETLKYIKRWVKNDAKYLAEKIYDSWGINIQHIGLEEIRDDIFTSMVVARLLYEMRMRRYPESKSDIWYFYKKYYNTYRGKATKHAFWRNYKYYVK